MIDDETLLAPRMTELPGDLGKFARYFRDWAFDQSCPYLGIAARRCFAAAKTVDQAASCRGKLSASEAESVNKWLAVAETMIAHLRDAYVHPERLECSAVIASHYGDAAWASHFTHIPADARTTMIAESRARLREACPTLATSARACLVAMTDPREVDLCAFFDPASHARGSLAPKHDSGEFGFPASGVVFSTGIAACDPYTSAVRAAQRCAGLSAASREEIAATYTRTMSDLDVPQRVEPITFDCPRSAADVEKQLAEAGCR